MPNMSLHSRVATAKDAPSIAALIQTGFRASDNRPDWTGELNALAANFTMSAEELLGNIVSSDSIVLLMEDQAGSPVSTVTASKRGGKSDSGAHGWLSMLAVDPAQQQSGLGHRMLEYAEQYCQQEWDLTRVKLNALSTRRGLISWYERHGYQRDGTTTLFPVHQEKYKDMGLPDDLHFVNLEKKLGNKE